ncbi:hypothetical protein GCM10007421_00870 [Halopseudomonas oceani]|jgi:tetratricopeptide (TPR) repeat protein|uniref:Lipoprotein n=1 Tax=Halopseudomonas oceani TaxID=1708783 RepID=A0A2P4EWD7_9GAMM|nr:hypothetical protein C1949_07555 [Halopseudomonas oceani]GGE31003.1 hypothetical protein GCM10007421_00870 [Halopseudomonas oceani]
MNKFWLLPIAAMLLSGCGASGYKRHLDNAYEAYADGDCAQVITELSRTERLIRSRPYLQPEISLLRGQCLERQGFYLDAIQIYRFMLDTHPKSEYSYRAAARLETLRQLGHYDPERPIPPVAD